MSGSPPSSIPAVPPPDRPVALWRRIAYVAVLAICIPTISLLCWFIFYFYSWTLSIMFGPEGPAELQPVEAPADDNIVIFMIRNMGVWGLTLLLRCSPYVTVGVMFIYLFVKVNAAASRLLQETTA